MFLNSSHENKRKKWPYVLSVMFLFLLLSFGLGYYLIKKLNINFGTLFSSRFIQEQVIKRIGPIDGDLFDLAPIALGFQEPQTYLVLFLNNTELRPGGGFIGVYATIRVDKGHVEILKVEGTETLDGQAPKTWNVPAPRPITEHLKVDRWYFRDSNWDPDFSIDSARALEFYQAEGGIAGGEIDGVIGVTATVFEELMKRAGTVVVDGITFTPENVIETLEHEVEFGYTDRGIHFTDRKDIIHPLMVAIMDRLKGDVLGNLPYYRSLAERLVTEKHIMVYAVDPAIQNKLVQHKWDGGVLETSGDYLMWVDANLAALKTDYAIERTLSYTIKRAVDAGDGKIYYHAETKMTYKHTRPFDWRTSRYRTYARVFVPKGSELISSEGSMKADRSPLPGVIDSGVERNTQWFGTFISVEPLTTKTLTFTYRLPEYISKQIEAGSYNLLVQKQLGVTQSQLTLDLNFDTTISSANPSEVESEWGNSTYTIRTALDTDQEFQVTTKH